MRSSCPTPLPRALRATTPGFYSPLLDRRYGPWGGRLAASAGGALRRWYTSHSKRYGLWDEGGVAGTRPVPFGRRAFLGLRWGGVRAGAPCFLFEPGILQAGHI